MMRGCYPTILRKWSEGKKDEVQTLLDAAVRMYLLIAVPAVAGVMGCELSGCICAFCS